MSIDRDVPIELDQHFVDPPSPPKPVFAFQQKPLVSRKWFYNELTSTSFDVDAIMIGIASGSKRFHTRLLHHSRCIDFTGSIGDYSCALFSIFGDYAIYSGNHGRVYCCFASKIDRQILAFHCCWFFVCFHLIGNLLCFLSKSSMMTSRFSKKLFFFSSVADALDKHVSNSRAFDAATAVLNYCGDVSAPTLVCVCFHSQASLQASAANSCPLFFWQWSIGIVASYPVKTSVYKQWLGSVGAREFWDSSQGLGVDCRKHAPPFLRGYKLCIA